MKRWKGELIKTAKELGYPKEVWKRLENAKNQCEATRIMITARQMMSKEEKRWILS